MTKALIPAAGMGSRVSEISGALPKCLMTFDGEPIIERIMTTARAAGIAEFVIVLGFEPEAIPRALGDGRRLGVQIEYVLNDRWRDLANGYSILAAKALVQDEFLILMSDHIFSRSCLDAVLADTPPTGGCRLLTDPRIDRCFDLADATKVRANSDGRILAMGKDLVDYNQLDTGIFYATRGLLSAIERNVARGMSSLTDANNELAQDGKMWARPLFGEEPYWLDIDTPEAVDEFRRLRHLTNTAT